MKKPKKIRTADGTYLKLGRQDEFQKFFKGLIEYLQKRLKKVDIAGGVESYYTCGRPHERYSQNWKSFPNLWNYTDKKGLDFYAVKNLLNDFFFRELKCTCEVLGGDKEVRRRQLKEFGVDFGEPGNREVDIVSGWELTRIDKGIF